MIEITTPTAYIRRVSDGRLRTVARGTDVRFAKETKYAVEYAVEYTPHAAKLVADWLWVVHGIPCDAVPTA